MESYYKFAKNKPCVQYKKLFLFPSTFHQYIVSYILATGKLSSLQSAYRPGYSTESALLKVVGDIERASGNGMCTVLLALDISAAFDAVNHLILCRRIE